MEKIERNSIWEHKFHMFRVRVVTETKDMVRLEVGADKQTKEYLEHVRHMIEKEYGIYPFIRIEVKLALSLWWTKERFLEEFRRVRFVSGIKVS